MPPAYYVSYALNIFLLFTLAIVLMLPIIMNIPLYTYIRAKWRKYMIIFLLKPDKRLEMVLAKPRSNMIETVKHHLPFMNVPEAVYNLHGIPSAIAYHKYGAILPAQNIIHSTEMRDRGFKNIGELEHMIAAIKYLLSGDKNKEGLYKRREALVMEIGNPGEGMEDKKTELAKLDEQIKAAEAELMNLQNVQVADRGIIRIQDIHNFLNKNLSTDVIFSIIERSVAEEMRGMRDLSAKFVQMFPYILTLIVFFLLGIMVILALSKGEIGMPSIQNIIPQLP